MHIRQDDCRNTQHGSQNVRARIANNIKRFKENIDFIDLKSCLPDKQQLLGQLGYSKMQVSKAEHIYVLSERGYDKLIKIMDTDLAWQIHDKMMDEYFAMKEPPTSTIGLLELSLQAIKENRLQIEAVNNDLQEFKQNMPILGVEESRITNAVRKKGVECLGGKDTVAYKDRSLRSKIYSDIYRQLKREYGVSSYKAIKRNKCDHAVCLIGNYKLPCILAEQVESLNRQIFIEAARMG